MGNTSSERVTKPAKTEKPTAKRTGGADPLPRTEVVSKVWDHIRTNSLQNAADKRVILADDKLLAVFGPDRCTMFEMQKLLSPHLTAA